LPPLFDNRAGQYYVYGHQPKPDQMTEKRANESESAARIAFRRAVKSLVTWGEDISRVFPHADVEFFPDAGSKGKTQRAALRVMFTRAVSGDAQKKDAAYAGFWVTAEANSWRDEIMYEIRPYRGPGDNFGKSHRSNTLPRWFGFALPHTFWSLHDFPLHDEWEGFRSGIEFSRDGRVPQEWRSDLHILYYNGYRRGIFEDPVKVLESLPLRPGLIPE